MKEGVGSAHQPEREGEARAGLPGRLVGRANGPRREERRGGGAGPSWGEFFLFLVQIRNILQI